MDGAEPPADPTRGPSDTGDAAQPIKHSKQLGCWTAVMVFACLCTGAKAAVVGLILSIMMVRRKQSLFSAWLALVYFVILLPLGLLSWVDLAAQHTHFVPDSAVRFCANRRMNTKHLAKFPPGARNVRFYQDWLRGYPFLVRCDMSRQDFDQWVQDTGGMGSKKIGDSPEKVRIVTSRELNRLRTQATREGKGFDDVDFYQDRYIQVLDWHPPWWNPTTITHGWYVWKDVGRHPRAYYDVETSVLYFGWR